MFVTDIRADQQAIHPGLADPPGDQLHILRTKIDNWDHLPGDAGGEFQGLLSLLGLGRAGHIGWFVSGVGIRGFCIRGLRGRPDSA